MREPRVTILMRELERLKTIQAAAYGELNPGPVLERLRRTGPQPDGVCQASRVYPLAGASSAGCRTEQMTRVPRAFPASMAN